MSDSPHFYRESMIRARKNHKCCECESVILKGEEYHNFVGMWDNFGVYKTCFHCSNLRRKIEQTMSRGDEPLCFGEMEAYIYESDDAEFSNHYLDIHLTRDIKVPEWLEERVARDKNKEYILVRR